MIAKSHAAEPSLSSRFQPRKPSLHFSGAVSGQSRDLRNTTATSIHAANNSVDGHTGPHPPRPTPSHRSFVAAVAIPTPTRSCYRTTPVAAAAPLSDITRNPRQVFRPQRPQLRGCPPRPAPLSTLSPSHPHLGLHPRRRRPRRRPVRRPYRHHFLPVLAGPMVPPQPAFRGPRREVPRPRRRSGTASTAAAAPRGGCPSRFEGLRRGLLATSYSCFLSPGVEK